MLWCTFFGIQLRFIKAIIIELKGSLSVLELSINCRYKIQNNLKAENLAWLLWVVGVFLSEVQRVDNRYRLSTGDLAEGLLVEPFQSSKLWKGYRRFCLYILVGKGHPQALK